MNLSTSEEVDRAFSRLLVAGSANFEVGSPVVYRLLEVAVLLNQARRDSDAVIDNDATRDPREREAAKLIVAGRLALLAGLTADVLTQQVASDQKAEREARRSLAKRSRR